MPALANLTSKSVQFSSPAYQDRMYSSAAKRLCGEPCVCYDLCRLA